jgi:hypothetical protein
LTNGGSADTARRQEGDEGQRADRDDRRGLADRARQPMITPVRMPPSE